MKPLNIEICGKIEDSDVLSFPSVAKALGVSKQYISKFKNKGIIGFCKLHKLSHIITSSEQDQIKTMSDWCLRMDTVELIKQSFEYAAITRNINLLNKLLEKHKKEKGSVGEYVRFYRLLYNYMIDEISGLDLIDYLDEIGQPADKALRILMCIMKCYNYYFQKKFTLMLEVAQEAERLIENLGDKRKGYIRDCYSLRLAEILAPVYLRLNNLELARVYAGVIISSNICAKTVSDATYIIGMTYLKEDGKKALDYLRESYEISKKIGSEKLEVEAEYNLEMARLYLKNDFSSREEGIGYLKKIKEVFYQKENEDFLVYFEAIYSDSISTMQECLQKFFAQSNYYFSSLLAKELYNRGEKSFMIEWLIDFKKERGEMLV